MYSGRGLKYNFIQKGSIVKIQKIAILSSVVMSVFAAPAFANIGDTATYKFDLPSTEVASQNPPYPLVATLTLTEVAGGIDFLLTLTGVAPQFLVSRIHT